MHSHNSSLDPFDILRLVAKEPAVFALPTRDRPNRIVSQQRRALTLARAVIDSQHRGGKKINDIRLAVIGGGFGGVTAALYAAQAGARVMLFEEKGEVLSRFTNSERYIDPTIADWPNESWRDPTARLRVLDWGKQGGAKDRTRAKDLAKYARDILRRAPAITNLEVHRGAVVNLLPASKPGAPRRLIWSTAHGGRTDVFDAIVVATGFGDERTPRGWIGAQPSYWENDPALTAADRTVAIIGNGDGALMELARLLGVPIDQQRGFIDEALDREQERKIANNLGERDAQWHFDHDTSGRASDRSVDVSHEYFKAVSDVGLKPERLRPPLHSDLTHIYVFGRSADLLALDTYAINRLLVALLLEPAGDRSSGRYVARCPTHRIIIDYVCADAE